MTWIGITFYHVFHILCAFDIIEMLKIFVIPVLWNIFCFYMNYIFMLGYAWLQLCSWLGIILNTTNLLHIIYIAPRPFSFMTSQILTFHINLNLPYAYSCSKILLQSNYFLYSSWTFSILQTLCFIIIFFIFYHHLESSFFHILGNMTCSTSVYYFFDCLKLIFSFAVR